MLRLRHDTPPAWTDVALADLDAFLQDHAANERKVSHSATMLAVHNPDRPALVDAMVHLAIEEMGHFKRVYDLLIARGVGLGQDTPDPYMGAVRRLVRKPDCAEYLLDRLLLFGVVEARGCERFTMLAAALPAGPLKAFYGQLSKAEARHHALFVRLARQHFDEAAVRRRLGELLDAEAAIAAALPLRPALH